MFNIQKLNKVSQVGLDQFTDNYHIADEVSNPDAILVRSKVLHEMEFNSNLKAIVRIGAGVNTIPLERCTDAGICVFNCPGGNANSVKELVVAMTIAAMRNVFPAMNWVKGLNDEEIVPGNKVEDGKEIFLGSEIMAKTIGIIGVGAVGSKVARACYDLGIKVMGYDPFLPHLRRQELSQFCNFTDNLDDLLSACDVISVHIPLEEKNKGFIGKKEIEKMKDGVFFINYARGPVVDNDAVCDALDSGKFSGFATDFPTAREAKHPKAIFTPHLGAATPQAEENCCIMGARQCMDYLENGNITNSVNLPDVSFARADGARITVIHKNQVGMLGLMTDKVSAMGLNIENLVNKGRDKVAYTILDFNTSVPAELIKAIEAIDGVIRVRVIE